MSKKVVISKALVQQHALSPKPVRPAFPGEVYPPGADTVTLSEMETLTGLQSSLVQVSLSMTTHHELWGALHAASAALEAAVRIARRDYERYGRLSETKLGEGR